MTNPVPIPDWVTLSGSCSELGLEWENVLENECEEGPYTRGYGLRVYPLNPDGSFDYASLSFRPDDYPGRCPEYTFTDTCGGGCQSFAIGIQSSILVTGGNILVNRSQYYFRYDACDDDIDVALNHFDDSVNDGTIEGSGPGMSANGRMEALRNMMQNTRKLIEAEDYAGACDQLADIYKKCDGVPKPPDFVTGEATSELAFMIHDLQLNLGCE